MYYQTMELNQYNNKNILIKHLPNKCSIQIKFKFNLFKMQTPIRQTRLIFKMISCNKNNNEIPIWKTTIVLVNLEFNLLLNQLVNSASFNFLIFSHLRIMHKLLIKHLLEADQRVSLRLSINEGHFIIIIKLKVLINKTSHLNINFVNDYLL